MLTIKKRAFAEALLAGKSQTQSALSAGYSDKAAKQAGYKLARDKDVLNHIERMETTIEESKPQIEKKAESLNHKKLRYLDPLDFLKDVMNNESEDPKLRIDAAKSLMPYIHGKVGEQGKKEKQQSKANNALNSLYSTASPPKSKKPLLN